MTDGLDQALYSAGLALLTADASLTVYDGVVPAGATPPYVVVYGTVARPSDDPNNAVDGRTHVWVPRWICHCVGGNASAARAVAQRVRSALLDVRPTVAGFTADAVGPIRLEGDPTPPTKDETTGVVVMDQVETYRLLATN